MKQLLPVAKIVNIIIRRVSRRNFTTGRTQQIHLNIQRFPHNFVKYRPIKIKNKLDQELAYAAG